MDSLTPVQKFNTTNPVDMEHEDLRKRYEKEALGVGRKIPENLQTKKWYKNSLTEIEHYKKELVRQEKMSKEFFFVLCPSDYIMEIVPFETYQEAFQEGLDKMNKIPNKEGTTFYICKGCGVIGVHKPEVFAKRLQPQQKDTNSSYLEVDPDQF